ncbi:hypothetical protein BGZ73_002005 [Actinomortierella ambigua]|nr:hypothetical protein BGZ73_002005 [Actinomortierella ambigua]
MTHRASIEIRVFDRERKDRWYGALPYTVSSILQNLPISIVSSLAYILNVLLIVAAQQVVL